jgi:hypothetical protein
MHKHHVIPKHMGGSNDPSNIVDLTVEQHAEAHRVLFEQHGMWQDEIAWKGLAGLITHEEAARIAVSKANKGHKYRLGMKHTLETIAKLSKPKTEAHKQAMRGKRPHVNQTGGINNNACAINTPYGTFGSVSEAAEALAGKIPVRANKRGRNLVDKTYSRIRSLLGTDGWSRL